MSAELSLKKYRVGREILKQCFALESSYEETKESLRASLMKSLCAYDLNAAYKRANLNRYLKCRVYDLVEVSDAFAKFDEKKSSEVLEHAYNELVKELAEDLATKSWVKIREFAGTGENYEESFTAVATAFRASEILAPYNQVQAYELFKLVLKHNIMLVLRHVNNEDVRPFYLLFSKFFKSASKVNFLQAKKMAGKLSNSRVKLIALTSLVEGILSKPTSFADLV
ncbi:MAG: hypothetical protein H0T62_12590 [Parachlamydiaceae bacterium]|nr:hypothetical protein [Parachlamydiaceae bacterium]